MCWGHQPGAGLANTFTALSFLSLLLGRRDRNPALTPPMTSQWHGWTGASKHQVLLFSSLFLLPISNPGPFHLSHKGRLLLNLSWTRGQTQPKLQLICFSLHPELNPQKPSGAGRVSETDLTGWQLPNRAGGTEVQQRWQPLTWMKSQEVTRARLLYCPLKR